MSRAWFKYRGMRQTVEADVNPHNNTISINDKLFSADIMNWDAPVSGTVYGTLLNYKGALAALGESVHQAPYLAEPKAPILYMKPVNTVIGHEMPIPRPTDAPELEIGAALGIVIGRTATRVSEHQALEYVIGYTIVNDISIPHDSVYRPAVKQKARDGFCPIGPWVIERSAVNDPDSLAIRVFINDEQRQENTTANLIRPVARLLSDITEFMTLYPGDVLLAGIPENAPLAKSGDRIRIEIEGIGSLNNTIVDEEELIPGGNR